MWETLLHLLVGALGVGVGGGGIYVLLPKILEWWQKKREADQTFINDLYRKQLADYEAQKAHLQDLAQELGEVVSEQKEKRVKVEARVIVLEAQKADLKTQNTDLRAEVADLKAQNAELRTHRTAPPGGQEAAND